MMLDRPVHAPQTTDRTTARAVAAPAAPGSAMHGDLEQTLNPSPLPPPPPPRSFGLG